MACDVSPVAMFFLDVVPYINHLYCHYALSSLYSYADRRFNHTADHFDKNNDADLNGHHTADDHCI